MADSKILLEVGTNEVEIAEFGIYLKDGKMQYFGINVAKVREIIKVPSFTKMPDQGEYILGVFELREKIIPLINLSRWLGEKTDVDLSKCYVIVTEFNKTNFGFLVHSIETIHRMSWENVMPPPSFANKQLDNSVTGIVNLDDKIMMMIDFEKIVGDINPKLAVNAPEEIMKLLNNKNLGKTVLVAEDSQMMRNMIKSILEKAGFNVEAFNNGQLVWDKLSEIKDSLEGGEKITDKVITVVSDIEMPQKDGHSLLKDIRDDPRLSELPVILFSSLIYEEIRKKGEDIGADAQISKPEIYDLLKIMKEVLEKRGFL